MSGQTLSVSVNDGQIKALLGQLQQRLGNLAPVMDEIGSALQLRVQRCFDMERSPGGTPWKSLAASTIAQRTRRGRWPGPILRREGELYRSVVYQATATQVVVGAGGNGSRPYAAIHQEGGMAGRGRRVRIPARPYLYESGGKLPAPWLAAVRNILNDYLAA